MSSPVTFTPEELATLETNPFACRDLDNDLKANHAAKIMFEHGRKDRARLFFRCGSMVKKAVCPKHGPQEYQALGCGVRMCPFCFNRLHTAAMARSAPFLTKVASMNTGKITFFSLKYKIPKGMNGSNLDYLHHWALARINETVRRVRSQSLLFSFETHFHSVQCRGIEDNHLHFNVFIFAESEHKLVWPIMFYDADVSEIEIHGPQEVESVFWRHTTLLQFPHHAKITGYNEVIFTDIRMLRNSQEKLSLQPDEESDNPDNTEDPGTGSEPIFCKICGERCHVTIADTYCRPQRPFIHPAYPFNDNS